MRFCCFMMEKCAESFYFGILYAESEALLKFDIMVPE